MSVHGGPDVVNDGLVFYYDISNSQKSWKGAPTTNLLATPLDHSSGNWGRANMTVVVNSDLAPDGTMTATTITATSNDPYLTQSITVTAGVSYTGSIYIKGGTNSIGKKGVLWWWIAGTATGTNTFSAVYTLTSDWQRITTPVFVPTGSGTVVYRLDPADGGQTPASAAGDVYYVWGAQAEVSTFATPFIAGIRSNTQALTDLTGINTITANSLTYATDGTFSFNGSSNYITVANSAAIRPSTELTVECVIRPTATPASWSQLIGYGQADYANGNYLLFLETGTTLCRALARVNNTEYRCNTSYTAPVNQNTHITFTMKAGDAIRSYFNGIANITSALPAGTFTYNGTTSGYQIASPGGSWYPGSIYFLKIYNRALSATEVAQNFNALRARFGI